MRKNNLYIVRKFIVAHSALDAIKNESKYPVHDVFLEDNSFKEAVLKTVEGIKKDSTIGFNG